MGDDLEPTTAAAASPEPISHTRVLVLMALIGIAGSAALFFFDSAYFASGFLIGSALAFVNYFWLKRTIAAAFAGIGTPTPPRLSAFAYVLRYAAMAAAVAILYGFDAVSMTGLFLGLAIFGPAVAIEGLIRIFTTLFGSEG